MATNNGTDEDIIADQVQLITKHAFKIAEAVREVTPELRATAVMLALLHVETRDEPLIDVTIATIQTVRDARMTAFLLGNRPDSKTVPEA